MDAAFFQRGILHLLAARDCGYAIKVGYWSWLPLKAIAAACRRWHAGRPGRHRPRDRAGHPAVARPPAPRGALPEARRTTRRAGTSSWICSPPMTGTTSTPPWPPTCRWASRPCGPSPAGAGAQEKTFAELKGEFALDVVPTKHYAANSAWQQLEHPRPQPDPQLPAGDPRRTEAPVPQAHLRLPLPQHAHAPVPAHRPGRAPDPPRRPERAPPDQEPRDGDAVWADRSPSGGLIYSPIGAKSPPPALAHELLDPNADEADLPSLRVLPRVEERLEQSPNLALQLVLASRTVACPCGSDSS